MVYLFIGQDYFSKDIKLKKLRQEFLSPDIEQFNLDILYARELNLKGLQEKLLYIGANVEKRMVVIKDAQNLNRDIKDFLIKYVKNPHPKIILVLDITDRYNPKDEFIRNILKFVRIYRFREEPYQDTFSLCRDIEQSNVALSLKVLNGLLKKGERAERILGGLRYAWEDNKVSPFEVKKRIRLLLNCDIDIKTGRLKPDIALEKLVVGLCYLNKTLRKP